MLLFGLAETFSNRNSKKFPIFSLPNHYEDFISSVSVDIISQQDRFENYDMWKHAQKSSIFPKPMMKSTVD